MCDALLCCPWHRRACQALAAMAFVLALSLDSSPAAAAEGWTDDRLVAGYAELRAGGRLEEAIRSPALPGEPPHRAFLDALAWFADGAPDAAGALSLAELDRFLDGQVGIYTYLLEEKVEREVVNDYARTRTWKVIQKLTMLRQQMATAAADYRYPRMPRAAAEGDAWERQHTLSSPEEFAQKVCRDSHRRPVLVKFGNTNCTQCHLFEMIGSIKELADSPAYRDVVDVYKVWWGLRPDDTFAGRIRDPRRLDELAAAEGVRSSPSFVVYRNGRRYPCGDAFPDVQGEDQRLDTCLERATGEAPLASVCEAGT